MSAVVVVGGSPGLPGPAGSPGLPGPTSQSESIVGATPASDAATEYQIVASGRTVGLETIDLYFHDLQDGESCTLEVTVQGNTEAFLGTCSWQSITTATRTFGGSSARNGTAAGAGPGQISNNFAGTKPSFTFSDPATNAGANTLHRLAAQVTGKIGVTILWSVTGKKTLTRRN